MKIYHYTTIQTLALILKHKTIRFNRLDRVDDMEESAYGSGPTGSKLAQYCFVSCWTKSDEENLALWNMYTRYKGVRIGIDEMPFVTYDLKGGFKSYFKDEFGAGDNYIYSSYMNEAKLYDIEYVDEPEPIIKELIHFEEGGMNMNAPKIGVTKRKEWSMQRESRFKVYMMPIDMDYVRKNTKIPDPTGLEPFFSLIKSMGASIVKSKPISKTFVDLPLAPDKLEDIDIMMGPLTTEADRIIVESLLASYKKAVIKDSAFYGKLREKNR